MLIVFKVFEEMVLQFQSVVKLAQFDTNFLHACQRKLVCV